MVIWYTKKRFYFACVTVYLDVHAGAAIDVDNAGHYQDGVQLCIGGPYVIQSNINFRHFLRRQFGGT